MREGLKPYLEDNIQAWDMQPDGTFKRARHGQKKRVSAQADLLKALEHTEIPYTVAEKEACCGMPKLELGDIDSVIALGRKNLPVLAKLAREGYTIVTPIPSCTLMFKQELPLLLPKSGSASRLEM